MITVVVNMLEMVSVTKRSPKPPWYRHLAPALSDLSGWTGSGSWPQPPRYPRPRDKRQLTASNNIEWRCKAWKSVDFYFDL